jgi:Lrp/AsnC family transcriptional regulator
MLVTELDQQDKRILNVLQQDASLTSSEIAERVNMSQSPCWRRIKRLQDLGVIKRQVAILNRESVGVDIVVFATVNLAAQSNLDLNAFEEAMSTEPLVVECYTMAGTWDYMLKIITKDIKSYEHFIRHTLTANKLVREIHSHIAVTEIKNSTALPLD